MKNSKTEGGPKRDPRRKRLSELREALLHLHKALIESERIAYERAFGVIPSPGAFLQLLIQDPWFVWLQPLSAFIAFIDETLDEGDSITNRELEDFLKKARILVTPSETGEGFGQHYFEALQRDPDVVLAHAKVRKQVSEQKTKKP